MIIINEIKRKPAYLPCFVPTKSVSKAEFIRMYDCNSKGDLGWAKYNKIKIGVCLSLKGDLCIKD